MDSRQRAGHLTANLSSWRPASPASLPPEMCGTVPSSVSPPASARGQWPFSLSIDTWASLPSRVNQFGSGLLATIRLLPIHVYIYNMWFVSHMLFYFLGNLRIAQLLDFS